MDADLVRLWGRCPDLRPSGLVHCPVSIDEDGAEYEPVHPWRGMFGPVTNEEAEALIGWKCIDWLCSTNDYWEQLGNVMMRTYGGQERVKGLIGLCHQELDHRDQMKAEDAGGP